MRVFQKLARPSCGDLNFFVDLSDTPAYKLPDIKALQHVAKKNTKIRNLGMTLFSWVS